jgi:hypothetical protein
MQRSVTWRAARWRANARPAARLPSFRRPTTAIWDANGLRAHRPETGSGPAGPIAERPTLAVDADRQGLIVRSCGPGTARDLAIAPHRALWAGKCGENSSVRLNFKMWCESAGQAFPCVGVDRRGLCARGPISLLIRLWRLLRPPRQVRLQSRATEQRRTTCRLAKPASGVALASRNHRPVQRRTTCAARVLMGFLRAMCGRPRSLRSLRLHCTHLGAHRVPLPIWASRPRGPSGCSP